MSKILIIIISVFLISNIGISQHKKELKLNHCLWKFKDCGQVMIEGTNYRIKAMNTIEFESQHETTMYTDSNHVVTVQKTPTMYYFSVLYPDGRLTCEEIVRDRIVDWFLKVFILP